MLWDYSYQKVLQETVQIQPQNEEEKFKDLQYTNGKLYLITNQRILRFNRFGQLTKNIPFKEHNQVEITKDQIIFSQNKKLFRQSIKDNTVKEIPIKQAVDFFAFNGNSLFVLDKKVMYIYDSELNLY